MSESIHSSEAVASIKADLDLIDSSPIGEHAQRFESLHRRLESELSTIDGL